jgi:hypothetical protein
VSEPSAAERKRSTSDRIAFVVTALPVLVFVAIPVLGLLLLWAWGRAGSE